MDIIRKEIIFFLPDVDAGVTSIVRNLLKYRPQSNLYYKVIFTRQIEREAVHVDDHFNVDEQIVFSYSKYENLHAVVKRLRKHVADDAILVANDGMEFNMVQLLKMSNPLVYIIHGDFKYYYSLVAENQGIIDQYIAYSQFTALQLKEKIDSQYHSRINLCYYPVPEMALEQEEYKAIDLLFVGSFHERKGIQFLYKIFKNIQSKITTVNFTIVGSGALEADLKEQFLTEPNVTFKGQLKNDAVCKQMMMSKILLFPSLSEGLPNVVVESMKAKCVPVCSDIPSGIPDLIEHQISGFKGPVGDTDFFAEVAVNLLNNEEERKSIAMRAAQKAITMFQPEKNARIYEETILNTMNYSKKFSNKNRGGKLNQRFIPNAVVKFIRKMNISAKI